MAARPRRTCTTTGYARFIITRCTYKVKKIRTRHWYGIARQQAPCQRKPRASVRTSKRRASARRVPAYGVCGVGDGHSKRRASASAMPAKAHAIAMPNQTGTEPAMRKYSAKGRRQARALPDSFGAQSRPVREASFEAGGGSKARA